MNKRAITMMVAVAALGGAVFPILQTTAFSEPSAASTTAQTNQSEPLPGPPSDPWQADQLIKPEELIKSLSETTGEKPLVLQVGFLVLAGMAVVGALIAATQLGPQPGAAAVEMINADNAATFEEAA